MSLLSWLDNPSAERGIRFSQPGDQWDLWSYERLAELTRRVAQGLIESGVPRDAVVMIVQRPGPHLVATLFGAMFAGTVPSLVAPPMMFGDRAAYDEHLRTVIAAAQPALIVVDGEFSVSGPTCQVQDLVADAAATPRTPAGLALLQFTSGSTGRCRGVRVPHAALESNVAAIHEWSGMDSERSTASWLPVHHDMGLIGCLLAPVVAGSDLWLMPPEEFIARPLRYLRCFGEQGAGLTAMPTFGLEYLARRIRPHMLDGLDFSGWRGLIVGAERVAPEVLHRFHALLAPAGFAKETIRPAYGLAEATLAVTGLRTGDRWRAASVDARSLSIGDRVLPGETLLTGCGRPLSGVEVSVVDDDGNPLADGHVGEIAVAGTSVTTGYLNDSFSDGVIRTGDAGWLDGGELFVIGRIGDGLKVRGRMVFAEDLEAMLTAQTGIPSNRVAVLLGTHNGVDTVVAAVENARKHPVAEAMTALRSRADGAEVHLLDLPPGTIPRTSSGKPRRRHMWRMFADGQFSSVS